MIFLVAFCYCYKNKVLAIQISKNCVNHLKLPVKNHACCVINHVFWLKSCR